MAERAGERPGIALQLKTIGSLLLDGALPDRAALGEALEELGAELRAMRVTYDSAPSGPDAVREYMARALDSYLEAIDALESFLETGDGALVDGAAAAAQRGEDIANALSGLVADNLRALEKSAS